VQVREAVHTLLQQLEESQNQKFNYLICSTTVAQRLSNGQLQTLEQALTFHRCPEFVCMQCMVVEWPLAEQAFP
jgi:hypothetical protein